MKGVTPIWRHPIFFDGVCHEGSRLRSKRFEIKIIERLVRRSLSRRGVGSNRPWRGGECRLERGHRESREILFSEMPMTHGRDDEIIRVLGA